VREEFKLPNGVGIVLDSNAVIGGGYLFIDSANGRYTGVLQLEMYCIAVKAVGLISTRMPDGSSGFSMLLIISAEFQPVQLGFGFTLNGVGGLIGVDRTMDVQVLQDGIKNHSLDSILFPADPLRDIQRILRDLNAAFPPAADRYVFGPMAIIGWGSPPIIRAKIGVLLEIPSPRLVLLGQGQIGLPSLEVPYPLILIQVDVLGNWILPGRLSVCVPYSMTPALFSAR